MTTRGTVTASRGARRPHRVSIAVMSGMPLFEIAVPCEVFGTPRPDLIDPPYSVQLCAVSRETVVTDAGLALQHPGSIADFAGADTLLVPALATWDTPVPDELVEALRAGASRGARIAAICTGAFALAAAGLLDGRTATTHWMYADFLARRHPLVRVDADVLYTVDGQIATSAGTAAGMDLCIELVRRDHGTSVAADLARRLVVPPHREGGQAQYVVTPLPNRPVDSLAPVLDWALAHLNRPVSLVDLAREAGTSPRTLTRRFVGGMGVAPLRWLTGQRVRRAQELLESTDLSIEQVAERSGLGSAANLRVHFGRQVGTSPTAYRKIFAARSRDGATGISRAGLP